MAIRLKTAWRSRMFAAPPGCFHIWHARSRLSRSGAGSATQQAAHLSGAQPPAPKNLWLILYPEGEYHNKIQEKRANIFAQLLFILCTI